MNYFIEYLKDVFLEGVQKVFLLFDALGVILFFFSATIETDNPQLLRSIGIIIVAVSFMVAHFNWYRIVKQRFPKGAHLSLMVDSQHFFVRSWSRGIPLSEAEYQIDLFMTNRGDEPAVLTEILVKSVNTGTSLVVAEQDKIELQLTNPPHGSTTVALPQTVESRRPLPNLRCIIPLEVKQIDRLKFAERLAEFQSYEIELQYTYRNLEHEKHTESLTVTESYQAFVADRIREWRQYPDTHDLARIAIESIEAHEASSEHARD